MSLNLPVNVYGEPRTIYFSVAAKMAQLLGRQSIANPVIALLELVKNSYDADATEVKIIFENIRSGSGKIKIIDDGVGMDEDDISSKWMRAATDDKERNPLAKKFNRRKIGEKGIGRFATERIARKVILISKCEGKASGNCITVNWKDFESPNADFEKVPNQHYLFKKKKNEHGLEIYLEDLTEKWDADRIKSLRQDLSLIIPPTGAPQKFKVVVKSDEFKEEAGEVKSQFLKDAEYVFSGKLEENGNIKYKLRTFDGKEHKDSDTLKEFSCGPLEFTLHFFYLGPSDYLKSPERKRDFELRKNILQDFGGIKIYRDGFRVKPFGDPDNDWLGLDPERVNSPGVYPGNNQIFGIVRISKDKNPAIVDVLTREGVISNPAFLDMVKFIKGSLKFFSKKRAEIEGKTKKKSGKKKTKKRKSSLIKESFRKIKESPKFPTLPEALLDNLPNEIKAICNEINGCLYSGFYNAAAILMRKTLEAVTIIKFQQEGKEQLILKNGEFEVLSTRIEIAKQNGLISKKIADKLIKDNKLKLYGDTAAHSFRIQIREEDIGPLRDQLRLVIEDISLKKK